LKVVPVATVGLFDRDGSSFGPHRDTGSRGNMRSRHAGKFVNFDGVLWVLEH
jgi:hypothetical protein